MQVAVAHQTADVLRRLHALGVVHHQVCPSTLVRGATGVIHLADLGFAALCTSSLRSANLAFAHADPSYAAPEQTDENAAVTERALSLYIAT